MSVFGNLKEQKSNINTESGWSKTEIFRSLGERPERDVKTTQNYMLWKHGLESDNVLGNTKFGE